MAWDKLDGLIRKVDVATDLLVGFGLLSRIGRGGATQVAAPAPSSRRDPSAPKIPKILLGIADVAKREEISKWLKQYIEGMDRLERLGDNDLIALFDKSEAERDQIIVSLGIPLTLSKKLRLLKEKVTNYDDPELGTQLEEMAVAAEQRRHERELETARCKAEIGIAQDCVKAYRGMKQYLILYTEVYGKYKALGRWSQIAIVLGVAAITALTYQFTR